MSSLEFNPNLQFGVGVFETAPIFYGNVPLLDEHVQRLEKGLRLLGASSATIETEPITKYIKEKLPSSIGVLRIIARTDCDFKAFVSDSFPYSPEIYKKGLSLSLADNRKNEFSALTNIKSLNYLENYIERKKARSLGFDDALFLNTQGFVAETSSANVFAVKKNIFYTPAIEHGILPGIIRAKVINFLRDSGFTLKEHPLELAMLYESDLVFVTNSLLLMMPVNNIGNVVLKRDTSLVRNLFEPFPRLQGYNSDIRILFA